jgi:membrane protease YdiL (CAAX protease family)
VSVLARRLPAPQAALLCAGLAAAVGLRLGVAGAARGTSAPAGAVFGGALLWLAAAAGWRPGRPCSRSLLVGLGGGAALLVVPLAMHSVALPGLRAAGPVGALPLWLAVVTLVAVAEEALLRGALIGVLLQQEARAEVAVLVAALAFAALHVPFYGWGAAPLDVAAGVWLGGLRLATGGFGAPALAHAVADWATWWLP